MASQRPEKKAWYIVSGALEDHRLPVDVVGARRSPERDLVRRALRHADGRAVQPGDLVDPAVACFTAKPWPS